MIVSTKEPEDPSQKTDPSLMKTKFFIPPVRPGHVTRPRLLERLQAIPNYKLTIVSAPAGFGKTTLVSEWASSTRKGISTTWLSLDQADNDPVRFWHYFITAVRKLRPNAGGTALSRLRSPEPYSHESVLTSLINDVSNCPDDCAIILDDYHLIKADPVHAGITFLLDHMPPRMHLVVSTRTAPPIPLARLRGRGTMLEIGADDLRFSVDEATALLAGVPNVKLVAEDVMALNARTEGWAAGLTIAALSLSKHGDAHRFITTFTGSHRYIMDYLIEEVLRHHPAELQDFLLRTSVLERLTDPLCEHLTGISGSREMLARMEPSAGGFLVPLDESRQWYRYHHLLAELLRHQLEVQAGREVVAALHRRASQWYEDNGFLDDAVRHSLKAGDWERAVCLVDNLAGSLILRGEMLTLLDWLRLIPEAYLRIKPPLYRRYTDALITTGDLAAAEHALTYLEQTAGEDTNLQGENLVLRANIARHRGDALGAIRLGQQALSLLPEQNVRERSRASSFIGRMQFGIGQIDEAERSLETAYQGALKLGYQRIAAEAASMIGLILEMRGKAQYGEKLLRQAIEINRGSPAVAQPECVLSLYLYEHNQLEEAARLQHRAIEECLASGDYRTLTTGYSYLAYTRSAQGDYAAAVEAMGKAEYYARTQNVSPFYQAQMAGYGALIAIRQNNAEAFAYWNREVIEHRDMMPSNNIHIIPRVLIALGEKAAAAEQLQALYLKGVKSKLPCWRLRARIYQVLIAATPDEALALLTEALETGQPEDIIRSFADEGRQLAPLLREALRRGITSEFTARLLNIIASEGHRCIVDRETAASAPPSGLVSERELEILRLLSAGHSNREIAERLIVTAGTVKVHVHNLMEKLNARSRTQAVSLARSLKLL
jgi:LuxR family maltose regulon positive regulatory protein